jgi:hypothetical protein
MVHLRPRKVYNAAADIGSVFFLQTLGIGNIMTTVLQEAFEKAAALPVDRQATIAAVVIEEIDAEEHWRQSFARSQDALSKLAAEALAEDDADRTLPMGETP